MDTSKPERAYQLLSFDAPKTATNHRPWKKIRLRNFFIDL
jgi:hypothetical protein